MANFFTPVSQKPKDRTIWSERGRNEDTPATLLVGRYSPELGDKKPPAPRRKIAAFDLDSTLIATNSGKKHSGSALDWKWWDNSVPGVLRELQHKGYQVVILSNQGGLTLHFDPSYKGPKGSIQKRVSEFKQKCSAVLGSLDVATSVYAATGKDIFRKPRTGMWDEVCEDYDMSKEELDLVNSFFVGDAGGRVAGLSGSSKGVHAVAKDFSCSDRNFAHNVGIQYHTPEEYFLGEKPREFIRDFDVAKFPLAASTEATFAKKNDQDVVLFCGPPGAGKSSFYWKRLKPLGYERVNQDILKSRDKCLQAAQELLAIGSSVAVG